MQNTCMTSNLAHFHMAAWHTESQIVSITANDWVPITTSKQWPSLVCYDPLMQRIGVKEGGAK